MPHMARNNPNRMSRMTAYAGLGALTLLAVAGMASAIPLGLAQDLHTPAGSASASYADYAANACISPSTPALPAVPAVPAVPLPLPVALPMPSVGQVSGAATVCADASPDGISASIDADAAGHHIGTGADVDTSKEHEAAKGAVGAVQGFFEGLYSALKFW